MLFFFLKFCDKKSATDVYKMLVLKIASNIDLKDRSILFNDKLVFVKLNRALISKYKILPL